MLFEKPNILVWSIANGAGGVEGARFTMKCAKREKWHFGARIQNSGFRSRNDGKLRKMGLKIGERTKMGSLKTKNPKKLVFGAVWGNYWRKMGSKWAQIDQNGENGRVLSQYGLRGASKRMGGGVGGRLKAED